MKASTLPPDTIIQSKPSKPQRRLSHLSPTEPPSRLPKSMIHTRLPVDKRVTALKPSVPKVRHRKSAGLALFMKSLSNKSLVDEEEEDRDSNGTISPPPTLQAQDTMDILASIRPPLPLGTPTPSYDDYDGMKYDDEDDDGDDDDDFMMTPPPPPPSRCRPSLDPSISIEEKNGKKEKETSPQKRKPPPLPQNRCLGSQIELCTSSPSTKSFWNLARYLRDSRSIEEILRDYPTPPSDLVETLSMLNIASMCYDISKNRRNDVRSYFVQRLDRLQNISSSELSCCLLAVASALRMYYVQLFFNKTHTHTYTHYLGTELISIMKGSGSPHQSLMRSSILKFVRIIQNSYT
jgi:hypothetical protein